MKSLKKNNSNHLKRYSKNGIKNFPFLTRNFSSNSIKLRIKEFKFPLFFFLISSSFIFTSGSLMKLKEERDSIDEAKRLYNNKNFESAKEIFERLSQDGDTDAMNHLSEIYLLGKGIKK